MSAEAPATPLVLRDIPGGAVDLRDDRTARRWCWDLYDAEVYGAYRIMRGGGWADPARGCMVTNRRRSHPTFGIDDLGFCVVRDLDPGPLRTT